MIFKLPCSEIGISNIPDTTSVAEYEYDYEYDTEYNDKYNTIKGVSQIGEDGCALTSVIVLKGNRKGSIWCCMDNGRFLLVHNSFDDILVDMTERKNIELDELLFHCYASISKIL